MSRRQLVEEGKRLEKAQPGTWLLDAVQRAAPAGTVVVDACKTRAQIAALRCRGDSFGVHLTAEVPVRRARFNARREIADREEPFDRLLTDPIEQQSDELASLCDLTVDTSHLTRDEALAKVLDALRAR
jgi:hypothetical protein